MKAALLATAMFAATPAMADRGVIDHACMKFTKTANGRLCDCIQRVANITLTGVDQQLAARFFENPARADEIRASSKSRHQAFWKRYVRFGQAAELACSN